MPAWALILINTAFWCGLHFGFAGCLTHLPQAVQKKWFDHRRARFTVSAGEMRWYRRIGLPKWKDRLPQFNNDFDKRRLRKKLSAEYLEEFIFNTCRAEVIHTGIALLGYLSLLFCLMCEDPAGNLPLFAVIATVVGSCNLPFSMIQRYNRSRLEKLLNTCRRTGRL